MAEAHCPCCEETVRLPVARLPINSSVRCPWCNETRPSIQWTSNLPPLPIVYGADGEPINLEDSFDRVSIEPSESQTINSDLSESGPSEITGMDIESTERDAKSNGAIVGDDDDTREFDSRELNAAAADATNSVRAIADLDDTFDAEFPSATAAPETSSFEDDDEDEDDFSVESPTMEEIEDAWESNRVRYSQDSNSEPVSQTLRPRDLDFVEDEVSSPHEESRLLEPKESSTRDQNQPSVSVDDDQHSHFEHGASRRRPRNFARFLKLVSPAVVVVSGIAGILIYSGIDLGIYPSDGASDSVAGTFTKTPDNLGRTAIDSIAVREFPGDASGFNSQTDQMAIDSEASPRQSSYQNPVLTTVEDLILSLDGRGQEMQADTADTAGVTIETVARRQLQRRNAEKQPAVQENPSNELNGSLLVFPSAPPSADSIRQAVANSEADGHDLKIPPKVPGDWTENIPHVAELTVSADPPSETVSSVSELTVAEQIIPIESSELIRACDRAATSLEKLTQAKDQDVSPAARLRAELMAFRDLSRVGSVLTEPESPRVDAMFSVILHSEMLPQLAPLCHEWIEWKRRTTDGILVIGTIRKNDGKTTVELADGSRIDLEVSHAQTLPIGTQSAMLGRIISINDRPSVRLVSAVAVP